MPLNHGSRQQRYSYVRPDGIGGVARTYGVDSAAAYVMCIRGDDGRWRSNGVWSEPTGIANDNIVFVEAKKVS